MAEYDAIIIGAGHNSLACAVHLLKKGWSVAVFEKNDLPGGAVKTLELTQPGFRHDFGAMNLNLFAGSAFHKEYANELKSHGLEFVPASDCFASVFPDGRWLGVSTDVEITTKRIAAFSPDDAATWQKLLADFPGNAEHIIGLLGSPMTLRAMARIVWTAWRKMGIGGSLELARLMLSSPRAWLDGNFQSEQVKATLAAWGMHLDFAPDIAGGAVFPYLESMAIQSFGLVIGKGGADTMITALSGMIAACGGGITTSAEVTEIITSNGKATGVRLADGTVHQAKKAVIANIAPGTLSKTLLPDGSGNASFDAAMENFRHAPGTMMIHLALDALPEWSAGEGLKRFAYVHLAPSLDVMAQTYTHAISGILPATPVIVVGQPTALDPSRAPQGKHALWVQVRLLPAEIKGDALNRILPAPWHEVRENYADRVLDVIETYAPGLRASILQRTVFSPLDLERENINLVGGDQVCGSHHLSQNFFFRPAPGYARWNTPVEKLHLVGAATWPGAGVGAASGYMLARQLGGK